MHLSRIRILTPLSRVTYQALGGESVSLKQSLCISLRALLTGACQHAQQAAASAVPLPAPPNAMLRTAILALQAPSAMHCQGCA